MMKNKISEKKMFMMLSTELFAMTSLILPAVLVGFAGKNGLPVLLAASSMLFLQAWWYVLCYNNKQKSLDQMIEEKTGMVRFLLKAVYVIRFFIHGLFLTIIFVNLISEVLLPDYPFFWILIPLLFLIWFMEGKTLTVRGRILEVLFSFIFIPLLLVLFLALFQIDYSSLTQQLWLTGGCPEGSFMLYGIYGILLFYQPVEFILFLLPALESGKKTTGRFQSPVAGISCLFVIGINVIMYVTAIGMFGTARTGDKLWSALYIMQSVRLPGKFVERLDILFLVFWIFSAFALISAYLYYGGRFIVPEFDGKEENGSGRKAEGSADSRRKSKWYTAVWIAAILLLTLMIRKPRVMFDFFVPYKMWVDFPLSILIPTLLYWKNGKKVGKKVVSVALFAITCGFLLTGCQDRADIEDKNYVMTMGIEKGEEKRFKISYETADLSQANQDGGGQKGRMISYEADSLMEAEETDKVRDDKKLDYGHLKVILFSKELMEAADLRKTMIEELEQKNNIAGTTLLFFTEEKIQSVIEVGEQKGTSFGEYMDTMMTNQKSQMGKEDTLAKLLRDEVEKSGDRSVWMVKSVGKQIQLERGILKGVVNQLSDSVVRFHIRANSDSKLDQERKNKIKDRILPKLQTLLSSADSKNACLDMIEESLNLIGSWVEEACRQENFICESKVYICRESFPLKVYGDMVFPSGIYDALRIDLGKGEGANWWCMMYPSLCFTDGIVEAVDQEGKDQLEEKLDEAEYEGLFFERNEKKYSVKWKIGEWMEQIFINTFQKRIMDRNS